MKTKFFSLVLALASFSVLGNEVKSSSKLPTQCKAVENPIAINKLSDVKETKKEEYLLTQPSKTGEKTLNIKYFNATGNISYESIDYSTRVYVHCLTSDKKYAFVRVTEPHWLTHRKGWVKAKSLTASLTPSNPNAVEDNKNKFVVTYDTRSKYQGQTVEFIKTKAAFCGSGQVRGIRGKGILKVFNPDKTMGVEVFPCVKETEIKLPDGRVLHLRKAI